MKRQQNIPSIFAASFFLLVLILDSKTALQGASEGVDLCLKVVIPALFPFFLISILLTTLLAGTTVPFLRPLGRLLRLPEGSENLLLIGLLGGYPVGAQCIAQTFHAGHISRRDAERMLAFCNNAGPSFIFGIGAGVLRNPWLCWVVWLIHILSAFIVGIMTPGQSGKGCIGISSRPVSVTNALQRTLTVLASVCGWIIIFRTILAFFQRWFLWMLPNTLDVLFCGILELANGSFALSELPADNIKFLIFTVILSFGGICVTLQTYSVLAGSGLSKKYYFPGKVTQAAISYLLCTVFTWLFPQVIAPTNSIFPLGVACGVCIFYRMLQNKSKNAYSISEPAVV